MKLRTKVRFRGGIGLSLVVLGLALFALGPATALGQSSPDPLSDPTAAQYNTEAVSGVSAEGTAGSQSTDASGSLPFTGMDLVVLAGVAVLLTGTGFALRRLSMPRSRQ
jgi:hypothetical protein